MLRQPNQFKEISNAASKVIKIKTITKWNKDTMIVCEENFLYFSAEAMTFLHQKTTIV